MPTMNDRCDPHAKSRPLLSDTSQEIPGMRLVSAMLICGLVTPLAWTVGNGVDGQKGFGRDCGYHAIQPRQNGIGPSLFSGVGRESRAVVGYLYSPAMVAAQIRWDDASLNRFLANPQSVVHGTKMFVAIPDEHLRQDIVASLDTLMY
jgi:cytochrome c